MPLTKVPNVIGMGAKDAVYMLQKRGMRVRINGYGQIVKQDIAPGSTAIKGKTVTLTAEAKI
jgi:cell division protein FtsI (penicillin-binding protein 3)